MWQDRIAAEMGIAVAPPAPAPVVSPNRKHISMGAMTAGTSSVYVQRYQGALRRHAKKRLKIKVKNINPSKATGYYGVETKQLTRTVKKKLSRSSKKWQRIWNNQPRGTPNKALVKKIGKTPIG
jgi:hypothetical protein